MHEQGVGWRKKGNEHPQADCSGRLEADSLPGSGEHDKSQNEELAASPAESPRRPELRLV